MEVEDNADSGLETGNTGKVDSLNDAIAAAMVASENKEAPVSEATTEEPAPSVEDKAGDKPRAGEDAGAAKDGAPAREGEAAKPGDAKPFEAPQHWPEDRRKAFAALPQQAQEVLRGLAKDLEGGFTRRSQELGDRVRYAEAVRSVVDDTARQQIAAAGMTEPQYFGWLHRCQTFATSDPVRYSKWVMQQLGVQPEHLGILPQKQPEQPKAPPSELDALLQDPRVNELQARLDQLHGKLSQREQAEQQYYQQQQYAQQQQEHARKHHIVQTIESFRTSLDDNGQLRAPHFDKVRTVMASLLDDPSIANIPDPIQRMQAAYNEAVWARPDLRASFLEQEASKKAAAQVRAQEAARAKSVTRIKPASGVATSSVSPKSLDDIIRDAMGRHGV